MKTLKIILYSLLVLIVVAIIGGLIFISGIKKSALPKYSGEVTLSGLSGMLLFIVMKEECHIFMLHMNTIFILQSGYVMAQERFWQMDLIKTGNNRKTFGDFGEVAVQFDNLFRSLEYDKKSKVLASDKIRRSLSAYCRLMLME